MTTTALNSFTGKIFAHFSQLGKYGLVGLTALLFDYLILILLTELVGLHYLLSATVGFLVGLVVNYILAVRFVFKKSKT